LLAIVFQVFLPAKALLQLDVSHPNVKLTSAKMKSFLIFFLIGVSIFLRSFFTCGYYSSLYESTACLDLPIALSISEDDNLGFAVTCPSP